MLARSEKLWALGVVVVVVRLALVVECWRAALRFLAVAMRV